MRSQETKNKYFFGLGTVGRDMFYSMQSLFLMVFLTDVLQLPDKTLALVGGILTVMRIFDAFNDPFMGLIVDNTNSRYGKYKPWMLIGAVTGAVFFVLLFTDLGLSKTQPGLYAVLFAASYLCWDITYGLNDIAYWSMLPALSLDQKERERIGSVARVCADIGLFSVAVAFTPLVDAAGAAMGSDERAWLVFAVAISALMIGFQLFTVFGVKERRGEFKQEEKTTLRGMAEALVKNDQLLFVVIAMALFAIGYNTTTNLGWYFITYGLGDENMYPIFAGILGVSQLSALSVFPLFSKKYTRKQLYFAATVLVLLGYAVFFFAPLSIVPVGIAGVLLFVGEAFIQILMLMFLSDTIEYGQWKFNKRNQAVTLSVQPFINKIGGAIATGAMTLTLILSGINEAKSAADVTSQGITILKAAMFVFPLICILAGYFVYRAKFKIDRAFYERIVTDLVARGDIREGAGE